MAAGFDKEARIFDLLALLGFGSVEIGGITAQAQAGNARPRILRFPALGGLWNCMGLNNPGAEAIAEAIHLHLFTDPPIPIGINIAQSTGISPDEAADDIAFTFEQLWILGQYFTVNVSCPNVCYARSITDRDLLLEILTMVQAVNQRLSHQYRCRPKPVGVKISPDITDEQLADVLKVCRQTGIRYIVLVNTTTRRDGCDGLDIPERGGLSGPILTARAERMTAEVYRELSYTRQPGQTPIDIVGVGGIHDAETLLRRICFGANVCQLFTALVYNGPSCVRDMLRGLEKLLRDRGFTNVSEAVGTAVL